MRWSLESRPHHESKSNWESYRLFPTAYPRHPCPPSLSGPLPGPVVSSWRAVAPSSFHPKHSRPFPLSTLPPPNGSQKKKLQDCHPLAPPRLQPHPSPPLIIHSYSRALRLCPPPSSPPFSFTPPRFLIAAYPERVYCHYLLRLILPVLFIRLFFFACALPAKHNSPSGAARRRSIGDLHLIRRRNKPSKIRERSPAPRARYIFVNPSHLPAAARIPGSRHHALQHSTEIAVPVLARHTRPRLQRSPRRKSSPRPPREQQQQQQHPHIFANINGVPKRRPPSNEEAQTPAHGRHGRFRACAEEAGGGGPVRQHPATITTHQEAVRQGRGFRLRRRAQTD